MGWLLLPLVASAQPPLIINGDFEKKYPSAVALGAPGFAICSGNLVTPRIVLTAGHCQAGLPIEVILDFGAALVGEDAGRPDEVLALESAEIHPDYRELSGSFLGEYDVGVIVLEEDAPDSVEPIFFRTRRLEKKEAVGATITSVGFGLTETGASGKKKSAPLVVSDLDPMFVLVDSADNDAGANICSGDSGGPQFYEEGPLLEQWAVHSWGDTNCRVQSGSTRTDVVADWLLDQVAAVHGTTDGCEINGRYDDGVCDPVCDEVDPDCVTTLADLYALGSGAGGCQTAPGGGSVLPLFAGFAAICRRRR